MSFSNLKARFFLVLVSLFISALLVGTAAAQSGTTSIKGSVKDQTGAIIPGATVTLINPATNFTRNNTTTDDGTFNFPGIPPGKYTIEVTAANFKKSIVRDAEALVDNSLTLNIALEPGEVTAVVNVNASSIESVINTQDATIGNNFVPRQITQLPTDLRRVTDLLTLQPGVTREGYTQGARSDQTNVTLDGVDINDQQTGGRTTQFDLSQNTALRLTTEAVEEFRITTTNPNANQGRSSGAQISLVTKGGTNEFHGAGFYFYRPTQFSANDFFNNKNGVPRPSLARDVFGGAIGGPVIKDKVFFFYSYEGQREESATPGTAILVPRASLGQGIFRFRGAGPGCGTLSNDTSIPNCSLSLAQLNGFFPQAGINPAALAVFANAAARYPVNDNQVGDKFNTGGFRFNSPSTIEENTHIARFDWNINDSQQFFARGNYQWDITSSGGRFTDTPTTTTWSHPYGYVFGHNWTIGPNKVNNFRYGLTRISVSGQGDSADNFISFRQVFQPLTFSRTSNRVNPTINITDDFTWIIGGHTLQFGGNIRLIENKRVSFGSAFDTAVANSSFYEAAGDVVSDPLIAAGYTFEDTTNAERVIASMIGRFSQYTARFTFDQNGDPLAAGTPTERLFATEEFDFYVQDIWKPFQNLTLTLGLRYGLSRPVYEKNGFQVRPTQPLGKFLERRIESANNGVPLNELIDFELAGPVNNAAGFYPMDWNNFQPAIAAAWSPSFEGGFLGALFGKQGESTFRGGFRIVNDYFGQQLAVNFDQLSSIGFTAQTQISAETFNVTDNLAPRFTGFGQDLRSLFGIPAPTQIFSLPADESFRIQTSLDTNLVSPINYSWNFSYGRQLPFGMYVEANYVGRAARNLLGARDVMALNNIVDPASGMDWYTAATMLRNSSIAGVSVANVPIIPFFENLFPDITFLGQPTATQSLYQFIDPATDWTGIQTFLDDNGIFPNMFFHPQYAALSSFGTIASSDYHGASFNIRQRLGQWLTYDLNYTFSKSMDDVSGLQTADFYGSGFILNPLRPEDSRAVSDFDSTHVINANFIVQLPFGKGQMFDDLGTTADFFIGGWQIGGIYRYNTGRPWDACFDDDGWDTNWNIKSRCVRISPIQTSPTRTGENPNLFSNLDQLAASVVGSAPGGTGDRNVFRDTGYSTLDMSLSKSFTFPWSETHKLQFRWEVFNVTNTQYLAAPNAIGISEETFPVTLPTNGGNFTDTRGTPRRMQFGLRYSF